MKLCGDERVEFDKIAKRLFDSDIFYEMDKYIQHGKITTKTHCIDVAETCFKLNRRHKLGMDEKVLVEAALLHDFYLYDWHVDEPWHRLHGLQHPHFACSNAKKYFNIDDHTGSAIRSHMWPLTLLNRPKTREAWLLCMVDKGISLKETLLCR